MDFKKMNESFADCSCGKNHKCDINAIEIGNSVINKLSGLCKDYKSILLVSDRNTYKVCGEKVYALLQGKIGQNVILSSGSKVVIPNEESIKTIESAIKKDTDLIIGVGSGVINDLCKYVGFFNNLPYFIVATAPSMDGYASAGAAMILKGMKVTVNTRPPKAIVGDTSVLKDAPLEMLQAGYGDIIGKFSCLNDWKLSNFVNGEYFCEKVYNCTLDYVLKIKDRAEEILARDENAIKLLFEALVGVGVLMSYVNSSRPASGSEHHLSHFFEITGILENKPYFSHGVDVLYSTYYTQKIREALLKRDTVTPAQPITKEKYEAQINKIYKNLSGEVIALQNKLGWYNESKADFYINNFDKIKTILSDTPTVQEIEGYIKSIGLDLKDFEDLYGKEKIQNAVYFAKDLKDRYSVLWLNFELN